MKTVELFPAYIWDCEECGKENLQRSISVRLDSENEYDAEILRQMHGLTEDEPIPPICSGSMQTRPNRVTCRHCGAEFKAWDAAASDSENLDDDEDEEG